MRTVVLVVSGGVVQGVFSDAADLRVIKVDWDVGESPGDAAHAGLCYVDDLRLLPQDSAALISALIP